MLATRNEVWGRRRRPQAACGRTSRSMARPHCWRALVRSCIACRLTQNSGLVRKKRARRKAVSAVTERSPLMMAPIRVAGTRRAIARALADMPSGLRNSSLKISPGWVVTRPGVATPAALAFLVVVDDFDIGRPLFGPSEADAPLIIDAYRVLPVPISGESLQSVRRRRAQIAKIARLLQHIEFPQGLPFDAAEALYEGA